MRWNGKRIVRWCHKNPNNLQKLSGSKLSLEKTSSNDDWCTMSVTETQFSSKPEFFFILELCSSYFYSISQLIHASVWMSRARQLYVTRNDVWPKTSKQVRGNVQVWILSLCSFAHRIIQALTQSPLSNLDINEIIMLLIVSPAASQEEQDSAREEVRKKLKKTSSLGSRSFLSVESEWDDASSYN